jgi:hypothetical protein
MFRVAALLAFAIGLAACDAVNTVTEGFKYAKAVEADVEQATGVKPQVGFNWTNGRLVSVTVAFPRIYDAKPLGELADTIRTSVKTNAGAHRAGVLAGRLRLRRRARSANLLATRTRDLRRVLTDRG